MAGFATLEERMDDVRAVLDAVGSKRAAIVGVSEGAPMSALFAATYPDRTSAWVTTAGERCSSTVRDLVAGSGRRFAERGTRTLKGVPDEWRLFAVEA